VSTKTCRRVSALSSCNLMRRNVAAPYFLRKRAKNFGSTDLTNASIPRSRRISSSSTCKGMLAFLRHCSRSVV